MIAQQAKNQFCEVPIKLPIFHSPSCSFPGSKSARSFAATAVVGLGIVAAMDSSSVETARPTARSDPIPILLPTARQESAWAEEEMELSESYTCVISHVGKGSVRKRVYGGDGHKLDSIIVRRNLDMDMDIPKSDDNRCKLGLFYQSSPATPVVPWVFGSLKFCNRCWKSLEGIDIFMYRGEKAFCSADCRYQQMVADEYCEKLGPKSRKPFECSSSPCSAPLPFAAGVAAA